VTPILNDAEENIPELRLALRLSMPLGEDCRRHFDISPKLLHGMPAEKQSIEKSGLPLWKLEFHRDWGRNEL